jgi:hypothetical protein
MTISTGQLITAQDYNNIQSSVATILGSGSGDSGYGQSVASSQVASRSKVTLAHYTNLWTDLWRCRWHQTGTDPTLDATFPPDYRGVTAGTLVKASDWTKLSNTAATVVTNKLAVPPTTGGQGGRSNFSFGSVARTSPWNGTLEHTAVISFADSDYARYFFNSGGRIEISASIQGPFSAGSTQKDVSWNTVLTGMGTIYFSAHSTTTTGTVDSIASSFGFHELINSATPATPYILAYKHAPNTYNYYPNEYVLQVYWVAPNLYINPQFQDASVAPASYPDPGFGIDENVDGTTTSLIQAYYAIGSYVSQPLPPASSSSLA